MRVRGAGDLRRRQGSRARARTPRRRQLHSREAERAHRAHDAVEDVPRTFEELQRRVPIVVERQLCRHTGPDVSGSALLLLLVWGFEPRTSADLAEEDNVEEILED